MQRIARSAIRADVGLSQLESTTGHWTRRWRRICDRLRADERRADDGTRHWLERSTQWHQPLSSESLFGEPLPRIAPGSRVWTVDVTSTDATADDQSVAADVSTNAVSAKRRISSGSGFERNAWQHSAQLSAELFAKLSAELFDSDAKPAITKRFANDAEIRSGTRIGTVSEQQ